MPHDPARVAEVREWLARASHDLRAGDHALTAEPPLVEDALFHAQQAAEKAMKGFLAWQDRPLGKTHDLRELAQVCVEMDGDLEAPLRQAAPLTEYAWRFRYPGEPEKPSMGQAHEALGTAREAYKAILARLPDEAAP